MEVRRDDKGMPVLPKREQRDFALSEFEVRAEGDKGLTLTGYASVFDHDYDIYGGPPYGWTERIAKGAFTKTLSEKPDVQLLVNHEGLPLARTKSGTLKLSEDDTGLYVEAELDAEDPDVQRLRPKMDRGDMDEMSFAFRVLRQEWDEEYTDRTIKEVSIHRGDVSVVNYGANDGTSVSLRSLDALLRLSGLEPEAVMAELRGAGREDPLAVLADARAAIDRIIDAAAPKRGMPLATALALRDATALRNTAA